MEKLVAYIGKPKGNGMGCDRVVGQSWEVTDWHGKVIGFATRGATWNVNSYIGRIMSQWYARIDGREYTGRGFGQGMSIVLRRTAAQRRIDKENPDATY